ncbi:retrotransposon protein, putative, ty1-copia subclass [Tanacetum coccineum]
MMNLTTLSLSFWDYALESIARILIMVPTKKGCEALVKRDTLDKLQQRSVKCIFIGYSKETMGYYFYFPPENKIVVARYAKFLEKNLISQEVNGRAVELEEIQDEDTSPSEINSKNSYREVEEHSLGDLNKPANYKATMLDPKSNKWPNAMNAEMQSMKDNQVCRLVDLPPNSIMVFYDYEIWQMDVKTAFLNSYLDEDIYMVQLEGFVDPKHPKKVCKLQRSIYGHKQASRSWNKRFDEEIKRFGFTQNLDEPCVYQKAEAEYIAASEAKMEAVWIRKFISRLGIIPTINEPIKIFCDNSAALLIANEPGVQMGSRHYHRRYHYVRECIELGEINLLNVHTDNILADPFMKALSKGKLTQHARSMGLRLASSFMMGPPNSHDIYKMNIGLPQLTRLSLYGSVSLSESFLVILKKVANKDYFRSDYEACDMALVVNKEFVPSIVEGMANEAFIGGYPQAFVNCLPYLTSDHSAAMLVIPNGKSKKIKPFRFANYVADKPEFLDIVNNGVNGFAMFRLVKKLKNMKTHMNKLNWKHGNLFESAKQLKEDLKIAQKEVDRYPYGALIKANEVCLLEKYIEAVKDEEKLLFQMAKVEWLSKGDKNSRYFHKVLSNNEAIEMIKEVSDKEIKDAMFDIGDTKALGLNGYSAMFFKKSRGIIGDDVPIACCNVIYKVINKILTNRIKEGLHKLVNLNQSAFIPRRLIRDNLLITQELLKGYTMKNGPKGVPYSLLGIIVNRLKSGSYRVKSGRHS